MPSKESLRTPSDVMRQAQFWERIEELSIIQDEIADTLEPLNDREPPRNAEETFEAITLEAQTTQMVRAWQIVSNMAKYGDEGNRFDVDDSQLLAGIDFVRSGYFPLREDYVAEAVKTGETKGMNYLLTLLAPLDITDAHAREIYFSPWRRDFAAKRLGLMKQADGSAIATLPTRLLNIEFSLEYPAGSLYPNRIISCTD